MSARPEELAPPPTSAQPSSQRLSPSASLSPSQRSAGDDPAARLRLAADANGLRPVPGTPHDRAERTDADAATPDTSAVQPRLSVEGLSLDYRVGPRSIRATHRVDFDVMPGERFVLLGASGCGKSSLLKAVGGFLAPSEGRVLLDGQAVHGPGPDRMVVFQEFDQLPPWKTVLDNVAFPLTASRKLDKTRAREQARQWLERVGLGAFATAYPHQLSGGMKQRVAIARALALSPRMLLMDEPFAALDALTRRRMQEELLALWEQERFTLLFVTHSIEEALHVGHRILVLSPHPGRVRAEFNAQGLDAAQRQALGQRIEALLFES